LADKLLSLAAAMPEDTKLRLSICEALRTLSYKLPASSDSDKARQSQIKALLGDPSPSNLRWVSSSMDSSVRFASSFLLMPAGLPPGMTTSTGTAVIKPAQAMIHLQQRAVAFTSTGGITTYAYRDSTGLEFELAPDALALRDKPEAAHALELFPLPEAGKSFGVSKLINTAAVRLALGDLETVQRLPELIAMMGKVDSRDGAARFRHACAKTLADAGLQDEANKLFADLLKDASSLWPPVYGDSFDALLSFAARGASAEQRKMALDQFMTLARQCASAIPLDASFRQAIRLRAIPLLQADHRETEVEDLKVLLQSLR
jgi:hypothetical protein